MGFGHAQGCPGTGWPRGAGTECSSGRSSTLMGPPHQPHAMQWGTGRCVHPRGEKTPLPAGLGFRWKNLKRRVGLHLKRCFSARWCTAKIRFCGRSGFGGKPWVTSQRKKYCWGVSAGGFRLENGRERGGRCRGGELLRVQFGEALSPGCAGAADRLLT